MTEPRDPADVIIIGGGFYGCCLALFLRSCFDNVILLEAENELLTRASFGNQARVHTGYHYPRSFVTAMRSQALCQRFSKDFAGAIYRDFTMLYAIARSGSKTTPRRFQSMFETLGAPVLEADEDEIARFDDSRVSAVFRCEEYAFDALKLRQTLARRLGVSGVVCHKNARVSRVVPGERGGPSAVHVQDFGTLTANLVVDCTYGQFDGFVSSSPADPPLLKYELAEVALIEPPAELRGYGVTVMDGPFFSTMPFPACDCYSLTHVRYTPHAAWLRSSDRPATVSNRSSHWLHMVRDAKRYVPSMASAKWKRSVFEIKTVLWRSESGDGRPILVETDARHGGILRVVGGKLDNIYDLFDALLEELPAAGMADLRHFSPSWQKS